MIDGVLYTQDAHGLVIALDGETGRTIWEQPFAPTREEAAARRRAGSITGAAALATPRSESSRFAASISTPQCQTGVPAQRFGSRAA